MAFCLFPVFLFIPGYVLAWTLNVLEFRTRSIAGQGALSIAISVSVVPIVTYLIARAFSLRTALGFYGVVAMIFVAIIIRHRPGLLSTLFDPSPINGNRILKRSLAWVFGWTIIALLLLSDVQIGQHLYPNIVSFDYAKHIAVTDAITRTGVPPVNPSFFPGHGIDLFYYYFWFLLCSLVDIIGGEVINARMAVFAGTAWAGIALLAVIALYLRFKSPPYHVKIHQRFFIAAGLLLISGFDIVPVVLETLLSRDATLFPSVEWWNDQITAWLNAILWVPHHVAGLVAVMTGFLLHSSIEPGPKTFKNRALIVLVALAYSSALGLSIWVTFGFTVFFAVWMILSFSKGWVVEMRIGLLAGVLALTLSWLFLADLNRARLQNTPPVVLSVRSFWPIEHYLQDYGAGPRRIVTFNLLFLPLNYFIELGFFLIAGVLFWRTRLKSTAHLTRDETALLLMALCAALVATFVKANIKYNDLGARSFMLVQFPLLLWSVSVVMSAKDRLCGPDAKQEMVASPRGTMLLALALSLCLGAMTVFYDVVMMKLYPMKGDLMKALTPNSGQYDEGEGFRTYEIRLAYEWVNRYLPPSAIVQHNPEVKHDLLYGKWRIDVYHGLYGHRQVIAADPEYGTLYGIPMSLYTPISSVIARIFSVSADQSIVNEGCKTLGITTLVVKNTDPVWDSPDSWIEAQLPLFGNNFVKVFDCESFPATSVAR